ncbi:PHD and RING finger domain-containing protein 1-like isoform X2 [Conger conger]|uniref:PHD and RING finger domain-containing protein 1-like isoform X2 n=1 Tax=Conger conger TaxID=82655 RepID=UPI002A59DFE8|nr:PHD and RING finger domain-containing protein 1-like isoform X2 [Conger conger]
MDEEDSVEEGSSDSEESVGSREEVEAEEDRDEDEDGSDAEDGAMEAIEGVAARVPALLQDLTSDDDDAEKCPICLHSFQEQPVATPMGCQHHFCLDCILEWSKNVNSCPVDRIAFSGIHVRKCYGGKVQKTIPVQEPVKMVEEEVNVDFEQTSCEVCGRSDREDCLLLCDGCDAGYHIECLTPPLDAVPVEEWFCPECTSNNPHTDSAEEASEDEVAALLMDAAPTTSRLRTSAAGRTRSIARTRQSERVRATVNRNRITQARAIQHVPRYLIQSTWLDETISAVLNSSACARRGRTGEKHRKTQRKKTSTETSSSSSSKNRTAGKDTKLHRGHLKTKKPGQKQVGKKDPPAPHSRITKSLTTGKLKQSPPTRPVGGHPKIRPASLSIFEDPMDLDPFDDESSEGESLPLMDTSRRGLSHSALRSHQPVARPIQHGLPRHSISTSEGDTMEDSAPVPDLLGSILSGQSLLLMDSSSMVINRDGSLKLGKPASASSSKSSISSQANTSELEAEVHAGMASGSGLNGDAEPSQSLPHIPSSSPSFPGSPLAKPTSPLTPPIMPQNTNVCTPNLAPESAPNVCVPHPVNPVGLSQSSWSETSPNRPSLPLMHSNGTSDWSSRRKGVDTGMGTLKKDPLKPLWLDVSQLPRIPKIRKRADSRTGLQGATWDEQGEAEANWKQKQSRAGTSCTSSSSSSWNFTLKPSSSSIASFCSSDPRQTKCPTSPKGHVTSLGTAENRLSEKQRSNIHDPFHPMSSQLLGSDGVPERDALDQHAKGVMPNKKAVEPYRSETSYSTKERNKYLGYSETIKMERLCNQNLPQEGAPTFCSSRAGVSNADTEKCGSEKVLSSQKQDSILHSEKNKSETKAQHSMSSSCSAARGKANLDLRGELKHCHPRTGEPDDNHSDTETKRKSRERSGSCSHSKERKSRERTRSFSHSKERKSRERTGSCLHSKKERKRVRSSSESSLSESTEEPRRRKRCSLSRSPHRWPHSRSGDPPRSGIHSKIDHELHNRKGNESQGFSQPQFRSTSKCRDSRKDRMCSQTSCSSKDRSRSKDGKKARSRSLSRERKNEKDTSHSSHSKGYRITNSLASPADMENKHRPVSLKYRKDLTDHKEKQQRRHLSPKDVSETEKLKNAPLGRVKEESSAFVFHSKKGQSREEIKEKEKKGKREIKLDSEKMADTELIWVQSHIKSSCLSQMPSSVDTDPKSSILPIGKKEHFCKVTDISGSVSAQRGFVAKQGKDMKECLLVTDLEKQPMEISAEYIEHFCSDFTLNSLRVRRPDKAEVTGTACDTGRAVIAGAMEAALPTDTPVTVGAIEAAITTETPTTVSDMEATMTTDTPVTVGNMKAAMATDTPETVGDMEAAMPTDTPVTIGNMEAAMATDTPVTVGNMEAAMATDTPVTVGNMEAAMATDTPVTAGNMEAPMATDTPVTVSDMEVAMPTGPPVTVSDPMITDTSEAIGDPENTLTTDTPETIGNTENTIITDTPETIGDTENTIRVRENCIITNTPETICDAVNTVITDTPEPVDDTENTLTTDTPKTVDAVGDAKIMGRPIVKQEGQQALKPAVIMAFSTTSRRPVKRVTWSLQELDAPPLQPTILPPNTLRHSGKDASPSQLQAIEKRHLRERAIEEVKLAIRPFFQKKEITKDEYKEIWGKAVQKICCSKSGEISPERVANLVKAYVEKYKFLRKQQDRQSQQVEESL